MNAHKIKQLANQKGLDILEDTIRINESGVDFQVVYVKDESGGKWILRIPRRRESMRQSLKEKEALEIIRNHVSIQVPDWFIFSEDLIAYKELNGVPAATVDVEKQGYVWSFNESNVPSEYYNSLGKALAELHSLPQQEFKNIGIVILDSSELRASMKQRMENAKEKYQVHPKLWERWQSWLEKDTLWPTHVGVTHGDMHPGHILLDQNNTVTGIIDWTEVGIGDVSVDFLAHRLLFGEEGLKKLLDAYDNAGGRTWSGMSEHIVELLTTSGITVAEYAEASGMEDMHEVAAHMLARENG